jgi:hypothetical protein
MTPNQILNLNALSTAGCAVAMLLGRGTLYSLFGLSSPLLLDAIAVGLLAYAAALRAVARQNAISRRSLLTFTLVDDAWVVGSALVLMMFWSEIAPIARGLTIAVALVVSIFALLQFKAAGWMGTGMRRLAS